MGVLCKNGFLVYGHLAEKNNRYHTVLTCTYPDGTKTKPRWCATGLPIKRNRLKALELLFIRQQAKLEEIMHECNKKHLLVTKASTIPEFVDMCISYKEALEEGTRFYICPATANGYKSLLKKHIRPYFTAKRGLFMENLSTSDMEDFFKSLIDNGVKARVQQNIYELLSGCFHLAMVRFNLVDKNIMVRVDKPRCKVKLPNYMTADEMKHYLELLEQEDSPIFISILLACFYGLRPSEICGLKWDAVDFENNQIRIFRKRVRDKQGYYTIDGTKHNAGARCFEMEESVRSHLLNLKNQQSKDRLTQHEYFDEGHVCCHKNGKPYSTNYISKQHRKALEAFGLQYICLRNLRDSCASALAAQGYSLFQIAIYLGHRDPKSSKKYAHLSCNETAVMSSTMSALLLPKNAPSVGLPKLPDEANIS